MTLKEAKNALAANSGDNSIKTDFATALAGAVQQGEQVLLTVSPAADGGFKPHMYKGRGLVWAVLYTGPEHIKTTPMPKMITVDINKVIDIAYSNPHISGLVLDPESEPVYLTRRDISTMTDRKDPRLAQADWGNGIPAYTKQDLMVIEELMDFAMEEVEEQGLVPGGFEILDSNPSTLVFPNFVVKKDGELYFIVVEAAIAPAMPQLTPEKKKAFLAFGEENHARCLYASVGIGSRDPERFSKSIALCGDGFMVNFAGFVPVEEL